MDQGLDKNKPPSTSYRETFRRHRKLFCMPIILGALAATFFLFGTGRTYKSTANVWVDTNAPAPSSLGDSPQNEPPAAAEQALLGELLTTRAFDASVAETSLRGKSPSGTDAIRENVAKMLENGQVVGFAVGGQVLQVSASASSPAMAENVVGAVVAQLRNYTDRTVAQHDQKIVADGRAQVKAAQTALANARSNVVAYQARHPGVSATDPNYASLVATENAASTTLAQANTTLNQMAGGNSDGWSTTVIDPPGQASTTALRKSKMAEVILGGALAGALVSFLAVVALTPAKKETWEDELPIEWPLAPDVPPADDVRAGSAGVPRAPAQSRPAATAVAQRRLTTNLRSRSTAGADWEAVEDEERSQFRAPAPNEETMTEWGMLLLCAYIALGATGRLTRRQAGRAAAALTVVVIAVVTVEYSTTTPTDKYIPNVDSAVYATGRPPQPGPGTPPTSEDVTGVKAATWFNTDRRPIANGGGG